MRTLTAKEMQYVGGGSGTPIKYKDAPPTTLPTITVTPSPGEMNEIMGGFSTNQCSFGAFAGAAGLGAAGGGTVYGAATGGLKGAAGGAIAGATVGLAGQEVRCAEQIGNEARFAGHLIERR